MRRLFCWLGLHDWGPTQRAEVAGVRYQRARCRRRRCSVGQVES